MPYAPNTELLAKYRIESLIGEGAFGEVYRALHLQLKAPRALKVLRRDAPGVGSSDFQRCRERFQLEAQLGAQLEGHSSCIQVYDFEHDNETLILVMEYAPGGSLAERLETARRARTPLPAPEVLRWTTEIAEGLAALHALDAVHRDLKPSNILFDAQGRAKLADFGLAQVPGGPSMRSRFSTPEPHPGTPAYMSPEQRDTTDHLTPASDVFTLGCVLFEALTGRVYRSQRPGARVTALRSDVPGWIDALVARCLEKDIEARPWDGAELLELLRQVEAEEVARKQQEVEETARQAEESARRQREAKEAAQQAAARKQREAEEEARKRREAVEANRKKREAEEDARRRREAEEAAWKQREAEETTWKRQGSKPEIPLVPLTQNKLLSPVMGETADATTPLGKEHTRTKSGLASWGWIAGIGILVILTIIIWLPWKQPQPKTTTATPTKNLAAATQTLTTESATPPGQAPTQQPEKVLETPASLAFEQAPMLDSWNLPPVEERLPVAEDIKVITPWESIGKYGGTWNAVTWWEGAGNIKQKLYDPPIRWKADLTGYEPGLLIKMPEWRDGGRTITFTFRRGIKWSDGAPFTTADLKFWWEDLAKNEDYKMSIVPWWARNSDGTPITMEFPDDVTWVLKYDTPQYIMPYVLAQGFWEWEPLMKPAHFLKQYHPNYDGKPGAEGYTELDLMDRWFDTPGYPCLMAWCLKEYKAGEYRILERNPYYWKVDTAGNQLPYIDYIRIEVVEDSEVRLLQVAQGRYDCVFRYNGSPTDIPFLIENAAAGDFRLVPGWMNGAGAWPGLIVNQDYHTAMDYDPATESEEDKEIRALLRNHDFMTGLSYAMDRQRVVDEVWEGIAEGKQATISPQSPHFTSSDEGKKVFEEWANAYAEYSPEKAMAAFDAAGFVDADGDGIRDLPSGKPFTLILQLNDWSAEKINTDFLNVYKLNLEAVGVKVLIDNAIGTADGGTNRDHGIFMVATTHISELDLWTYPDWIFPVRGVGEGTRAFPQQGQYYKTGGEQGWKPEPGSPAEKLQALYRQGLTMQDEMERHKIIWEAVRIYIDEGPFIIAAAGDQPMPVVCKNYFKNVYEYGVLGPWAPGTPGNTHPEQFWMDK